MKKLFYYADEYIKRCTWTDLALLKICLLALGLLIGARLTGGLKVLGQLLAIVLFTATFIVLIATFLFTIHGCNHKGKGHDYEVFS